MLAELFHSELELELEAIEAITKYLTSSESALALPNYLDQLNAGAARLASLREPIKWKTGSSSWTSIPNRTKKVLLLGAKQVDVQVGDEIALSADWSIQRRPQALRGSGTIWRVFKAQTSIRVIRTGEDVVEHALPLLPSPSLGVSPTPSLPTTLACAVGAACQAVFPEEYNLAVAEAASLLAGWEEMHRDRFARLRDWQSRGVSSMSPTEALQRIPPADLFVRLRKSAVRPAGLGR